MDVMLHITIVIGLLFLLYNSMLVNIMSYQTQKYISLDIPSVIISDQDILSSNIMSWRNTYIGILASSCISTILIISYLYKYITKNF
jgi:multisubunit Na+/H+ antiporter MnhB subunit